MIDPSKLDLNKALSNMDEEQMQKVMEQVDEEQMMVAMGNLVDRYLLPHLEDVKQAAQTADSNHEVRAYYESLPDSERTAPDGYDGPTREGEFYHALDNLVTTLAECRERPQTGLPRLKSQLRDPYTLEALLLIFDNDAHIDGEYTEQLKEFGAQRAMWIGANVFPEMYTEAERRQVVEQMGLDQNAPQ